MFNPILMYIAIGCFFVATFSPFVLAADPRHHSIGWAGAFFAALALVVGK